MYIPNFNFLVQFEGKIGQEQYFFEFKKGEIPISPFLNDLGDGVDVTICYTTFDFLSIGLKKGKFCGFAPSAPPTTDWGKIEF